MLHLLDGTQHLRADVAALDALQIAPGPDAGFSFKPPLECFRECATVGATIGDEDSRSTVV
jgi:hypothetical protein